MALSTRALQISLHIYNALNLVLGLLITFLGIMVLLPPSTIDSDFDSESIKDNPQIVIHLLIPVGLFYIALSIFGIFAIKDEEPVKLKVYFVIRFGLFVLSSLSLYVNPKKVFVVILEAFMLYLINQLYLRYTQNTQRNFKIVNTI